MAGDRGEIEKEEKGADQLSHESLSECRDREILPAGAAFTLVTAAAGHGSKTSHGIFLGFLATFLVAVLGYRCYCHPNNWKKS